MTEILDDLAPARFRRQHEGRALPIGEDKAEARKHLVGGPHALGTLAPPVKAGAVAREHAWPRRSIGPVLIAAEHAAQ
ncbi:hypothetical protein RHSP_81439 [Rhizobium freirei PRF 81]|uniref:Uncharacterized protein n=1 Tax=Rhizobium freirei PRF 81 TaxID=363754 RepID=N6U7C1_9HYPH|nr:hypothetical protein RHSP_81439 [Rhizobium freirei PRF 81]